MDGATPRNLGANESFTRMPSRDHTSSISGIISTRDSVTELRPTVTRRAARVDARGRRDAWTGRFARRVPTDRWCRTDGTAGSPPFRT